MGSDPATSSFQRIHSKRFLEENNNLKGFCPSKAVPQSASKALNKSV